VGGPHNSPPKIQRLSIIIDDKRSIFSILTLIGELPAAPLPPFNGPLHGKASRIQPEIRVTRSKAEKTDAAFSCPKVGAWIGMWGDPNESASSRP